MYKKSSFPLKIVYRTKNLGNLGGMGVKEVWKSRWEGEGSKNVAIRQGGVDFFWNNPFMVLVFVLVLMKSC